MTRFFLAFTLPLFLAWNASAQQVPATYRISGTVVDATTGLPIARADISISAKAEEVKVTANDDGTFRFDGLEPGKYPLFGQAQGYLHEGYNQHGAFLTAVVVGPEFDSDQIILRLHRQAVIHGRVTDERGDPVRQAQFLLFGIAKTGGKRPVERRGQMPTNDLGEFRFAHLPPGRYYVVVHAQPWYAQPGFHYAAKRDQSDVSARPNDFLDVIYPLTFYPGVSDEHKATEINLVAGGSEEANIQLLPVPGLHLRLTNVSQSPKESIGVSATQMIFGASPMNVQVSGAPIGDGEYEVSGLPPTDVVLDINWFRDGEPRGSSIRVNANQGDTLDATQKTATTNVSGRVMFPGANDHPERTNIGLASEDNQRNFGTRLLKDGTFSISSVQPGTYHMFVYVPGPEQQFIGKISAVGAAVSGEQVTIAGSGDVQLTIAMASGVAHVDGLAKLDGKPVSGIMILLVPEGGESLEDRSRVDQSDSDGTFTLSNILPGKYLLMAIEDGWDLEWMNPAALKPYRDKGAPLQLAPNQSAKITVDVQRLVRSPN